MAGFIYSLCKKDCQSHSPHIVAILSPLLDLIYGQNFVYDTNATTKSSLSKL